MFIFAGLLGLMAAGAAAVLSFDSGDDFAEDDSSSEGPDLDELEATIDNDTDELVTTGPDPLEPDTTGPEAGGISEETSVSVTEDQIIVGNDLDEDLSGGAGDDQINGYAGDDTLNGGAGDDHLYGDSGQDSLSGGAGNDVLHGEDGEDSLWGNDGDDSLFGHMGDDLLSGGAGEDSLTGGYGDDSLSGEAGDDALHGGHGNDTLIAGDGADTLFGGAGNDLISGSGDGSEQGPDYLNGGAGDDVILAGDGDWVSSGEGLDLILLGDRENGGEAVTITDFDGASDSLVLLYEDTGADPVVHLQNNPDNPGETDLYVGSQLLATIQGGAGLQAADIVLMPQQSTEAAALTA